MAEVFIPTLHTFAMNNVFTGSCGAFRFRAEPKVVMATAKEVDFEQSTIKAEYWQRVFPMTENGRLEMKAWLEENI